MESYYKNIHFIRLCRVIVKKVLPITTINSAAKTVVISFYVLCNVNVKRIALSKQKNEAKRRTISVENTNKIQTGQLKNSSDFTKYKGKMKPLTHSILWLYKLSIYGIRAVFFVPCIAHFLLQFFPLLLLHV